MAMMQTYLEIDSVDLTSRVLSWDMEETDGDSVKECSITLNFGLFTTLPAVRNGNSVILKRGFVSSTDQWVISGRIDEVHKSYPTVTLKVKDKLAILIDKSVTYSYNGAAFPSSEAKISDIATDLIETWGGMTASVVDTGDAIVLTKFICRGNDVLSRLQRLAEIVDYAIYYNPVDDNVHFEPKGYIENSTTIYIGGATNTALKIPKWVTDNTQCVNLLTVKGAVQVVSDDQFFNGTGAASQVFTLAKKPIGTQVWEYVGGQWVQKTPGVDSSTSGTYHYTVDKESKEISATSSWTPAAGSNNVWVRYTNAIPVPVRVDAETSQGLYGEKEVEKYFNDIETVNDAEQVGTAFLSKWSEPFVSTTIPVSGAVKYTAGEIVQVIDYLNNENRQILVNGVKKKFPHKGDTLELGDKTWKLSEWGKYSLERIRRLEEENQKDTDLVIQIKNFIRSAAHKRVFTAVYKRPWNATNNVMIWGSPVHGIWGTNVWGTDADAFDDEELVRLVWPSQTIIEKFKTDFFKGSGTATWDTTNRQLVF